MRISREMVIAGLPAFELRKAFKEILMHFGPTWVERRFGLSAEASESSLACLISEGYVEQENVGELDDEGNETSPRYRLTIKGGALKLASAARPIRRATADKLVSEFIQRAQKINASDDYVYKVSKVLAFGSFLTDSPTLGDVDLAVELTPKHKKDDEHAEALLAYTEAAEAQGRHFRDVFASVVWPIESIHRELKNRSKAISLHQSHDEVLKQAETRLLYRYP